MALIVLVVIVLLLAVVYITLYNGLQKAKVYTEESWSQIDVQLKRRNDLIPNLVETTKGYAKHEKETLAEVVKLRNQLVALQMVITKLRWKYLINYQILYVLFLHYLRAIQI